MTRLERLREMRAHLDAEIQHELRRLGAPLGNAMVAQAAELYGVEPADLLVGDRHPNIVRARQAAMWLLRRQGMSLPQIAAVLECHHTTVLYGLRRIDGDANVKRILLGLEVA